MKHTLIVHACFAALLTMFGTVAWAFEVNTTPSGKDIKWDASDLPVVYHINEEGTPDCSGEFAAIQAAYGAWENVSTSYMDFSYGGPISNTNWGSNDGVNLNVWVESNWTGITGAGSSTISINNVWFYSSGQIVDSDIVYNGEHYTWSSSGEQEEMDVQNVATHETGHSLSLDDLYGAGDSEKTMYGYISAGETKKRTLHSDDIAGVSYLYPATGEDTEAPTMESIVEPQGQYYGSAPSFSNFGFDDDVALDDGWYQVNSCAGAWTPLFTDVSGSSWDDDGWTMPGFDALPEGSNTIYFKADDDADNVGGGCAWSWQFYKVTTDIEPPTMEPIVENDGQCYNQAPILSNFGFDDNLDLDDGWYQIDSYTGPWTALFTNVSGTSWDQNGWSVPGFGSLAEGRHIIYFRADDDSGNSAGESGQWRWQFYKDTTPPHDPTDVESPSHSTGEWSNDNTIDVTWTDGLDFPEQCGVEGYSILWNTSGATVPDASTDISVGVESATSPELVEGSSHYFHIRSKDVAGNWQNTVHLGPFCIDVTPPTVTIHCVDTIRTPGDVCFSFETDDNFTPEADILLSRFRVGRDGNFSDFESIEQICWEDLLQGGPYTLWVRGMDLAGNVGPTCECVFSYLPECSEPIKGDANCDCRINVLDVLCAVNIILEMIEPTEDAIWSADCNGPPGNCDGDGRVDVVDCIKIVNIILEIDACP